MTIQPPAPRRRGRGLTVLIVVLIVVICLVVAADRIGERVAEDQVGARLQQSLGTPERPRVEVAQIPFLNQLIARRFGEVRIAADQVPVTARSTTAELDRIDLALRQVTVGDQQLTAATVDGTAFADYGQVSAIGGAKVGYVSDGKITIDFTAPVGGQTVSGTLTGEPVLDQGHLGVVDPQLRVAGIDLPPTLVEALLRTLLSSFELPDLPFGLTLTSVTAGEDGITFGLAGRDLAVAR